METGHVFLIRKIGIIIINPITFRVVNCFLKTIEKRKFIVTVFDRFRSFLVDASFLRKRKTNVFKKRKIFCAC